MNFRLNFDQISIFAGHLMEMASADAGILAAGIGTAVMGRKSDLSRPLVARYYVKHKPAKEDNEGQKSITWKVPRTVRVPLVRDVSQYKRQSIPYLTLPTDVTDIGDLIPVGRKLRAADLSGEFVTGGAVVRWKDVAGLVQWAILTVGHGFTVTQGKQIAVYGTNGQPAFNGFLMATARPDQATGTFNVPSTGIDASLVVVSQDALLTNGLISSASAAAIPIVDFTFLSESSQLDDFPGFARQINRCVGFTIVGGAANLPVPGLGTIGKVLHFVGGSQSFTPGTSGSVMQLVDVAPTLNAFPVGLQVAATQPTFDDGYAISLTEVMKWCQLTVAAALTLDGRTLDSTVDFVGSF